MFRQSPFLRAVRHSAATAAWLCLAAPAWAAVTFSKGDLVRLTRSETLLFKGENFLGAPKGQEFTVLQHDWRLGVVYVPFLKEDGTPVAVTLPADAVELAPRDGWLDLLQGMEAFRDQRYDDAKRLLARAGQDQTYRPLAAALAPRINGAVTAAASARASAAGKQGFLTVLQGLRDAAEQLNRLGHLSLALALEEGVDRLGGQVLGAAPNAAPAGLPPSKVPREELTQKAAISSRAVARCRQAMALHRLKEASKYVEEGLKAEPARPELKALQAKVQKGLADAEDSFEAAKRMRRFTGGAVHVLTALDRGLKYCADHPGLMEMKKEMQSSFEERTSPPVTPEFLAAAKVKTAPDALKEGHHLYTTRCTECHDLDLLDSRSVGGWQKAVAGMAGRAHLSDAQQAKIIDYIAAAQNVLPDEK